MNERQWLACNDPGRMLREIGHLGVSYRKCRLFCCGYCRCFFWDHLPNGIRDAIEVAEAYADEAASKYRLRKAQKAFGSVEELTNAQWRANLVAQVAVSPVSPFASACLLLENRNTLPWRGGKKAVARLIREIFGYPFGPAIVVADPVLTWNDGTIQQLARAIYDRRSFDHLPVLADALEEAGCTNQSLLNHYRSGEEHVRGCWAVDAILGTE